jgi:hypothetical protein
MINQGRCTHPSTGLRSDWLIATPPLHLLLWQVPYHASVRALDLITHFPTTLQTNYIRVDLSTYLLSVARFAYHPTLLLKTTQLFLLDCEHTMAQTLINNALEEKMKLSLLQVAERMSTLTTI